MSGPTSDHRRQAGAQCASPAGRQHPACPQPALRSDAVPWAPQVQELLPEGFPGEEGEGGGRRKTGLLAQLTALVSRALLVACGALLLLAASPMGCLQLTATRRACIGRKCMLRQRTLC